jgi:hypothetical protein
MKTERQNMNMKPLILIPILIIGLGVLQKAQALSPAPDGGYPGRNTAEGQKALFSLTTGTDNAALGHSSLQSLTTGKLNTGVGAWTLVLNTADYNTACGAAALLFNGTGTDNTAVGTGALLFNTIGEGNTATGTFALYNNTEGDFNTANGEFTLYFNTTGERNTATGDSALYGNSTGNLNTATGNAALVTNTSGNRNTANGSFALFSNTTNNNTANGAFALYSNTTGNDNTANGLNALYSNTTGDNNTANGFNALASNTTGNFNIALGSNAGVNVTTASSVICIGTSVFGANVSNSCYIGKIFGATSSGGTAVFINSDGKLGTVTSSRRFKEEIKPMERASEALFALKPVTFRYKKGIDPQGIPQFGLVAEDVEAVNPDLVVRDGEGKVNTVRYEAVNAMLLNEFLKEHRKMQKLEAALEAVSKRLKLQEAKTQDVRFQPDPGKSAPQMVSNNR